MSVRDEWVERAVAASMQYQAQRLGLPAGFWATNRSEEGERIAKTAMRAALAAVAPLIRRAALEEAAREIDCGCECRDVVLAAKTKADRARACGRDPCSALDAAAIRALDT
jgi:hypothetical protein